MLDDVVVVQGDSWFDVNLHGGRRIVAKLLEQAARAGFEVISRERAIEAAAEDEIDAALPLATTELGLRWLLGQPAAWRALDPGRVDVAALLADMTLRRMLYPATVAIVGAPNVGKSTLANALFGQERAIVADAPGTTRDWVGGLADLGGVPVVLVDTPGRRETADPIEHEAIALERRSDRACGSWLLKLIDATQASGTASPSPSLRGVEKPWSGYRQRDPRLRRLSRGLARPVARQRQPRVATRLRAPCQRCESPTSAIRRRPRRGGWRSPQRPARACRL